MQSVLHFFRIKGRIGSHEAQAHFRQPWCIWWLYVRIVEQRKAATAVKRYTPCRHRVGMLRRLYFEYYSLAKHIAQSRNSLASYSSTTARGVYGEMLHIGILPEIPHRYKAGKTVGFII